MAAMNGKRKREEAVGKQKPVKKAALSPPAKGKLQNSSIKKASAATPSTVNHQESTSDLHFQVVTGSYERVLHGLQARIPRAALSSAKQDKQIEFSDTFLFAAHSSAIRCLAISPSEDADKRLLATGSSDERINVYSLSTAPPPPGSTAILPSLSGVAAAGNPRNKSLGSLVHHDRAITRLHFPVKSKLFSAAEDSTIAVSRSRDWTMLGSMKAPVPKPQGRPSGDTAAPGEIPAGVNDFAIHPSQKLMLSVGRGEKSLRLWNLTTGKKAGVLNFEVDLLKQVGESKFSSGEGRRVLWDEAGENYVVGFERGAAVFGIDSEPKAIIKPDRSPKVHQIRLVPTAGPESLIALSTEDGRILFYDTNSNGEASEASKLPHLHCIAQLGGEAAGVAGRIKDFEVINLPGAEPLLLFITAGSDGAVRIWSVQIAELVGQAGDETRQIGRLVATHETGDRVTCIGAFVMDGKASDGVADATEGLAETDVAAGAEDDSEEDSD
ncbi:Putative WD40/YVTN repeat-like-containing domain superfamily [Septoria linicola]|uniref:WD40/YVTN repeat-like-containing domain superfamily n=1 Tax=Septoria linicola TaxID=215465 RepID=A0A9Q9AYA3_9PEZI|nr:putative WD40/YVTN repeat-like-containing domain superfamily [Septoria linicola]USW57634.1 Putative WD40/YVTN repeat-like-containing domain superfamily [Septoria linicola]